ncbi:MAG TPA: tetratricopeptide repeat protein [Anaerolineales bacterium]|nr:tetratricopeptide repeat protein [Anaerolineales bacterium]
MAKVSLRAYNRNIEAMIDRGHLDEAIAHCQHILKTYPKHLETYRLLAKSYLEAKRHDEAVDIFSRVLVSEPSDFVAQVGMSIIRDEQNKLDDAIWHMERAFETQPSNAAIQGELQRLYGRRDGTMPPRIRMTRGALAHMYMQGELYPQAISETKGVLEEDQGRSDMQVLLAKSYFKSGHKNDAADAASAVLKRYPFCLDANRVLTEILGSDRPESADVYRRRVFELDPYAAQVDGSVFDSNSVGDAAVMLEELDWNGQPVGMDSDWRSTGAIGLESGEQPDWLKNALPETTSANPSAPGFASDQEASASASTESPAEPAEDIPDFLRAAGWGESTGAFDESQSSAMFDDEPAADAQPLEQADMPDWVKAMAPQETEAQPAEEEDIPDWINKIGTGELPVPSVESSPDNDADFLSQLDGQTSAPETPSTDDQPDWLKGMGDDEQPAPVSDDQPDLVGQPGGESESDSPSAPADDLDFLKTLESDEPEQPEASVAPSEERSVMPDTGNLGKSDEERDDSFNWLENLAAKQGATEGLLTTPEERREDEPDWVKQAKGLSESEETPPAQEQQPEQQPSPEETPAEPAPPAATSADVESLGKSDEERDDSFNWLENLAAKQGATEGLLTTPEQRREDEPDWVKQAKSSNTPPPAPVAQQSEDAEPAPSPAPTAQQSEDAAPAPIDQPAANVEDLGKSDEERDDSFNWLENLAAKQGATEGLLTTPEQRREDEPDWVKQAKNSEVKQQPTEEDSAPVVAETPTASEEPEVSQADRDLMEHARQVGEKFFDDSMGTSEQEVEKAAEPVAPVEDVSSWLEGLDEEESAEQAAPAPVSESTDDTEAWLRTLDEAEETPVETEAAAPVNEAAESSDDMPSWLGDLEKEEPATPATPASDDLPAWMRDDTGELVAEPTKIEPTQPTDWTPAEQKAEETVDETPPPPAPEPAPEPKPEPTPAPVSAPEPKPVPTPAPAPAPESKSEPAPEPEPVKKPAPQKKQAKPAPPPEPYKEPVTRKTTGMLEMPVDPILGSARAELSRSNIPGALETYGKLIKKGRFLEEVIYDLRDALYRYPVEVSIWQSLGDAYMRANQLQEALDAYTKAEELLR